MVNIVAHLIGSNVVILTDVTLVLIGGDIVIAFAADVVILVGDVVVVVGLGRGAKKIVES